MTFLSETVGGEHLLPSLASAGFDVGRLRTVERTLLDTFDGRLHAAGIRLEARSEAGAGTTLVVRSAGSAAVEVMVDAIPSVAGELPPGPIRSRLAPLLDVRAVLPVVAVVSQYATCVRRNDAGKAIVSVIFHGRPALKAGAGELLSAASVAEILEYEGYSKAAREAADLLVSLGLSSRPGDVLDLAAERSHIDLRGFVDSPTVPLEREEPALDGFKRVLENLAGTIDANWQGTVDAVDPEFLHDFRVAVRRTRSVLAHGKQVVPADARDHFGVEFRRLGTITSPPRDLDVYVIEWPGYVAGLDAEAASALEPVVAHIGRQRDAAHAALADDLRSTRYHGAMAAWRAWLEAPVDAALENKRSSDALGAFVARRLDRAQRRLLDRGRTIGRHTSAEELHELRKDAKRLRYLIECFGGLLPAGSRRPFVQRLKALQDNLGEHQDTEVHAGYLRSLSRELERVPGVTPDTLLAMGRMVELFEQRRQAAREDFAERFTSYDSKQTAKAFGELIDAAR
jgi:CHAD domain-containing protein